METQPKHDSRLLQKARQHGLATPSDLEQLAIERGCDYYDLSNRVHETNAAEPAPARALEFSNEELAMALLLREHRSMLRTRMGAALLGSPGNDAHRLAQLAVEEDCADLAHYIASCGRQVETTNDFWTELAALLPSADYSRETMPHLSRFVEMTGIDRGKVGTQMRWIRPS